MGGLLTTVPRANAPGDWKPLMLFSINGNAGFDPTLHATCQFSVAPQIVD